MLSIQQCRDLIDDSEKYSDEEIEKIRGTLYGLADLAFDTWLEKNETKSKDGVE
ncbi:MAG: hypothetical protein WC798_00035 [Candidatus Paceibacterota bacterium]|jgi:hypothetical protein